jgi:2-dehydro-3-deoxygalactonokinase
MSAPAAFIAGDWGTSNLRLALCDADGVTLEMRRGPGAAEARGRFPEVFDSLTDDWRSAHAGMPAVLCGMAGSTLGWREVPYLPCPGDLYELPDACTEVRSGVHIVPGLRCTNPLGAPDVMRGEETQLLGAQHPTGAVREEARGLVCMPGTHTKWVSLHDGDVQEFMTVPTGELFALLCDHSVLVRERPSPVVHRAQDFERGLAEAARHPEIPVLHKLFQARSLRLDGQLSPEGAVSWMSGLLIGADVAGAMKLFERRDPGERVFVVGAPALVEAYMTALAKLGVAATAVDGEHAAFAGLAFVYRNRFMKSTA